MFSLNLLDSVTKIFIITVKILFEPTTSCVSDQGVATEPLRQCNMEDL